MKHFNRDVVFHMLMVLLESHAHPATARIIFLSSPAFLEERAEIDHMHVIIPRRK